MSDPPIVPLRLKPIVRSKLAETVARQLQEQIEHNRLEPGTRLPSERELMTSFDVGRSTVREAVNGLAMLGLIDIRHGQGAFVAASAPRVARGRAIDAVLARGFTRDLFEARLLVEVEAARLAAERRTEAELGEIAETLEAHMRAIADGTSTVDAAVRFHVRIGEAAHSEVLSSFVWSFGEVMRERGPVLEQAPGYRDWELDQHRSVYEPIRDGDPDLAATRMAEHLQAVLPHHERIGLT